MFRHRRLDVVEHVIHRPSSPWEAEAWGTWIQNQPGLHSGTLSPKKGGAKVKIPVRFNSWEITYLETSSKPSNKACLNLNTCSLLLPVIAPPRAKSLSAVPACWEHTCSSVPLSEPHHWLRMFSVSAFANRYFHRLPSNLICSQTLNCNPFFIPPISQDSNK